MILAIARLTLRELAQRRLAWVMIALGLAYLAVFGIGTWAVGREIARSGTHGLEQQMVGMVMTVAGLYVIQFLVLVMAVVVSVDSLAGGISSGSIHTIVTKPLPRRDVVIGKVVGHVTAVVVFLVVMSGGVVALAAATLGNQTRGLPAAMALMALSALVVLGLSYVGGSLTTTLANGLVVFMLYSLALVGSWIERIGTMLGNEAAQYVGIVTSLIMPTEALWQRAAWHLLPPLVRDTDMMMTPFTSPNVPSNAMLAYAVLHAVCTIAVAVRVFDRRDL